MKIYHRILAAVLSAAIISAPAHSLSARAEVSLSGTGISAGQSKTAAYVSREEAAAAIRNNIRNRVTDFSIVTSTSLVRSKADISDLISAALAETGDPAEGDYIRWSIKYYSYSTVTDSWNGTVTINFSNTYNSTAEQEAQVTKAVDELLAQLDLKGKSNYEKISAVYNYVAKNVSYAENSDSRTIFSAYGAIVEHSAVCQGYALLMYRLLSELDVPCRVVTGTANGGNHAWNIAEAGGKFYYLDVTWDSTLASSRLYYFMRGSSDFDSLMPSYTHEPKAWGSDTPLYAEYSSGEFDANYPVAETAYNSASSLVYALGDTDGDSIIDSSDASAILEGYANLSTGKRSGLLEPAKRASDVNADSIIDSADASAILGYYAMTSTGARLTLAEYIKTL